MRKIKTGAVALGLFAGGMVIGQAFPGDVSRMMDLKPADAVSTSDSIYAHYINLSLSAKSAAQMSQAVDEARVRLDMIQIKQNAEIIRQLTLLNAKK